MEIKSVLCLGPEQSYSALAAKTLCPAASVSFFPTFTKVVEALVAGEADAAVLPLENSIQGAVRQNLDLLEKNDGLCAIGECVLSIDHRLIRKEGVPLSAVECVYSHEQAIDQCIEYLHTHFPGARYIHTDSTAACLALLDDRSAGIVGAHVHAAGYVVSDENIADMKRNYTSFLLVVRGREHLPEHSAKIFVCVSLMHRPGSLLRFLQTIDSFGLNLTKIESRPRRDVVGEYRFFIEFEGDLSDKVVQYALSALEENSRGFRILGAY